MHEIRDANIIKLIGKEGKYVNKIAQITTCNYNH